jgi:hypothetical protein
MDLNDDIVDRRLRSGRSTSLIPAVPAAWFVTTIAFMVPSQCSVRPRGRPSHDGLSDKALRLVAARTRLQLDFGSVRA